MQISAKERDAFSLSNLLRNMANDRPRGSFETELLHDLAQREGRAFDPNRVRVPWALLRRDMTAAGSSGSQYIVGTDNTVVADALRPWSVTVSAGINVMGGLTGNVTIPRTTSDATGQWLSSELDPISASQPTIGQVSLTPKTAAALVTFTKLLDRLQPETEPFIRAHLLRVLGQMVDAAVLNGSGASGEPQGLALATGIDTESGTSLAHAGTLAMQAAVAAAGAEVTAWIGDPLARKTLAGRDRGTDGGRFIWDDDRVLGRPAYATQSAPANSLFAGDWRQVVLGSWGSGIDISTDAYTGWTTGAITVRVLATMDVAIPHPAAFSVSSSIT